MFMLQVNARIVKISPAVKPNVVSEEKVESKLVKSVKLRTKRVEEVQGMRRSPRIANLGSTHVSVSNECSHTDISSAVMRSVDSKEKRIVGDGRVKKKNPAEGKLDVHGWTKDQDAALENVESKEKRIVEDGRAKEKNPAEGKLDVHGWTKNQDAALERAYFAAKPSPNFWKKVSRMVPGKTAQDCFNKIHSDLVTPPQVQPRSSHFSLSGSKLLEPTLNVRWPKGNKQRKLRAQKTLRHLVQKRSMVDQGYKADLFSVFEPIMKAPTQVFLQTELLSTPESKFNKKGCNQECNENSCVREKPLSRFRNSCETALVSPPVLKQVKNRALHEKYIDQLHCRGARRTAGSTKCNVAREHKKESTAKKKDDITVARNALIFEANDIISKFKEAQADVVSDNDDSEDGDACDVEDDEDWEVEDVFSLVL